MGRPIVISTGVSRERWLPPRLSREKWTEKKPSKSVQLIKGKDYVHGRPKNEWQGSQLLNSFSGAVVTWLVALACCRINGGRLHRSLPQSTFNGARAFGELWIWSALGLRVAITIASINFRPRLPWKIVFTSS